MHGHISIVIVITSCNPDSSLGIERVRQWRTNRVNLVPSPYFEEVNNAFTL